MTAVAERRRPELTPDIGRAKVISRLAKGLSVQRMAFAKFLPEAWPVIEPLNAFRANWHIDCIAEYLEAVDNGEIPRLVINIQPRSAKSSIVSVAWPVWTWTQRPWQRFIFASYSKELSTRHSVDRRRILESDWYRTRWGSIVSMQADQDRKDMFENTARGTMFATSIGGSITGMGADVIVFDDLINPKEAESKAEREKALREFDQSFSTRLNDKKNGRMVIVEQRLHASDLTSHVLRQGGWTHLCLPAMAEKKTVIEFPISKRTIVREAGDILHPDREGAREIEQAKRALGSRAFAAQYQQNPTSEIGNILKRTWWKFWKVLPSGFDLTITSWDMNFKETKDGSYVVGQAWGKRGGDYFLLGQTRQRMDFADTIQAVIALTAKFPNAGGHLIEDRANGPAIISALQKRISGIVPIEPTGSKIARAQAISPVVEAGNVYLPDPEQHPWVHEFIEEAAAFKGIDGEMNDQVDALTQAINWFSQARFVNPEELNEEVSFIDDEDLQSVGGFIG